VRYSLRELVSLRTGIVSWRSQSFAIRRPGVVAIPAELRDAFAELARDGRRQPCVNVFEATLPAVALGGGVQLEQPLPALARCAGFRIEEQVRFRRQTQQRGADDFFLRRFAFGISSSFFRFRQNQFCYEERVVQVRERILEALCCMNRAQLGQVRFPIFANLHRRSACFSSTGTLACGGFWMDQDGCNNTGLRSAQARVPVLQNGLPRDARPGVNAETVSSAEQTVWENTAAAGGERSGASCAAANHCRWRRTKRDRRRRQRSDILRIGAPVERLIAQLQVQVARRAHKVDTRRIKSRRGVRFRKIKKAWARVRWICDGKIEPAVSGLHVDGRDRRRRRSWRAGIDACGLARSVHGRDNLRQRLVKVWVAVLDRCELGDSQHDKHTQATKLILRKFRFGGRETEDPIFAWPEFAKPVLPPLPLEDLRAH
jgi:hypothetical protein